VWGCDQGHDTGEGNITEKPITSPSSEVLVNPGVVGVVSECDVAGRKSIVGDRQRQVAELGLQRVQWNLAAEILYSGDVGLAAANPSFKTSATIPAGWDPLVPSGIEETIEGLLEAVCDCWHGQLVLHVPQQFLPHFLVRSLVVFDVSADVYRMGAHLVSFDCYPNLGPDDAAPNEDPAADGSEVWMYVSPPPRIEFGANFELAEALTPLQNVSAVRAERPVIVALDPCCVIGAKAGIC
jgi:hypothetical protein